MALLEAMSWGLPVITTAVGGIPQLITHEVNGLLLSPGDIDGMAAAIGRLMSDGNLRQKLGSAARATVAGSFSLETAVERLERIYRRFGIGAPNLKETGP
jgi:glycosyltransferase involved in cell wall biosynthesis